MIIWIDAADFQNAGQWKLDTQFTHLCGSPYLLACHTPGVPVRDAVCRFAAPFEGMARVWVRTKNWFLPDSPGRFTVSLDGHESAELGDMATHDWYWQIACDVHIEAGEHTLVLKDKTGYFERCAAVLITDDMDFVPARPMHEYVKLRAACKNIDLTARDADEYDVVVAGAGPGGVPAAAAARLGARTLLIGSRSVLGGNASSEVGVGFNGASARQPNAREGGVAEEIIRARLGEGKTWQQALEALCATEKNLTVMTGWFVCSAETETGAIHSIEAQSVMDNSCIRVRGRQFIDCTGDGWLGYYAGAKYRIGSETKWQYDEEFAPERADTLTMSGCTMRGYGRDDIPKMYVETDHEVKYDAPAWVPRSAAGKGYGRNIEHIDFVWWVEAPNSYDDLYDAELARDELFRIQLGHYNYLKNLWDEKERARNYALMYMPYYDAKRESRRFIGDYVLTQNDCMSGRDFPDTVAHAGWPVDLHNPKGLYSGAEGPFFSNTQIPLTKIPFRCLYSKNISNLLFAGRCASVSQIALGTARVQNTIACMGQAVGTAAAMCVQKGINPRALGEEHLDAFRQRLLRDDQYIPGLRSSDERDIARRMTVTASSEKAGEEYLPHLGVETEGYELDCQRATFFARGVPDHIGRVWTKLVNKNDAPADVLFHVRVQADPDGYITAEDLCAVTVRLPAHASDWFEIPINADTKLRYLWLWTDKCSGVFWPVWRGSALDHTRSERQSEGDVFPNIRNETHCVLLEKPVIETANCAAANVINGYSRIRSARDYEWASDPDQGLPQWVMLSSTEKQTINTACLTFDTDMANPSLLNLATKIPRPLVTDYVLEAFDGDKWRDLARVAGNNLRHCVHTFAPIAAEKVRLTTLDSGDHKTARLFEIQLYNE